MVRSLSHLQIKVIAFVHTCMDRFKWSQIQHSQPLENWKQQYKNCK